MTPKEDPTSTPDATAELPSAMSPIAINLDMLRPTGYSMDSTNGVFIIDNLCSRDSDNVRDGNSVNYKSDNLTERYNNGRDKAVKSADTQQKAVGVPNHVGKW